MSKNTSITEMPYAEWLEHSLRDIVTFPVRGIALAITTDEGDTYTNYYNVSMTDKLVISGLIQQDATLDMMTTMGSFRIGTKDEDDDDEDMENDEEELV